MGLEFGDAIRLMRMGVKVCRKGWNGKGMWIALQIGGECPPMTEPFIYMKTAQNTVIPWLASQADMLADDWMTAVEGS